MKIIEFIGIPGSGKTSTAIKLIENLKEAGYNVPNKNEVHNVLLKHNGIHVRLTIFFKKPLLVMKFLLSYFATSSSVIADLRKVLFSLKMYQFYSYLSKSNYDFVVIDEGYYPSLLEYLCKYRIIDSKSIGNITRSFYTQFNIKIIYLKGNTNECVMRLISRDNININSKRKYLNQSIREFYMLDQYLSHSVNVLKKIIDVKYIDISENIEGKCSVIIKYLKI